MHIIIDIDESYEALAIIASGLEQDPYSWKGWQLTVIAPRKHCANDSDNQIHHHSELIEVISSCLDAQDGTLITLYNGQLGLLHRKTHDWSTKQFIAECNSQLSVDSACYIADNFDLFADADLLCRMVSHRPTIGASKAQEEKLSWLCELADPYLANWESILTYRQNRTFSCILCVDDDPIIRRAVRNHLSPHCSLITASSAEMAIPIYLANAPDMVFLDIALPDSNGLDLLRFLHFHDADMQAVMLSGNDYWQNRLEATQNGAKGFMSKPVHVDALKHYCVHKNALIQEGALL